MKTTYLFTRLYYNSRDEIELKFPSGQCELFAHVLPVNIDAWVRVAGVSLVVCVRECSPSSASGLADLIVFMRASEGSCQRAHCASRELYLAVMTMGRGGGTQKIPMRRYHMRSCTSRRPCVYNRHLQTMYRLHVRYCYRNFCGRRLFTTG